MDLATAIAALEGHPRFLLAAQRRELETRLASRNVDLAAQGEVEAPNLAKPVPEEETALYARAEKILTILEDAGESQPEWKVRETFDFGDTEADMPLKKKSLMALTALVGKNSNLIGVAAPEDLLKDSVRTESAFTYKDLLESFNSFKKCDKVLPPVRAALLLEVMKESDDEEMVIALENGEKKDPTFWKKMYAFLCVFKKACELTRARLRDRLKGRYQYCARAFLKKQIESADNTPLKEMEEQEPLYVEEPPEDNDFLGVTVRYLTRWLSLHLACTAPA